MNPEPPFSAEPDPAFEAYLREQVRAALPPAWKAEILANGSPPARRRLGLPGWRLAALAASWLTIGILHWATPRPSPIIASPMLPDFGGGEAHPGILDRLGGSVPFAALRSLRTNPLLDEYY